MALGVISATLSTGGAWLEAAVGVVLLLPHPAARIRTKPPAASHRVPVKDMCIILPLLSALLRVP